VRATRGQNLANARMKVTNKSGFKGACMEWGKPRLARIVVNGHPISLGYFDTPEKAHAAYAAAAQKYFGK
jgi:hypothetical protein